MELLSIKPTVSRPREWCKNDFLFGSSQVYDEKFYEKQYIIQSEAHDIDLRSVSQASLPTPLFSNPNNTTLLRSVKSLSDLSGTYRLDFSLANIRDEKSYTTQLAGQDQVTAKQRNRCVFEWLEGVEKKPYFVPTI
uniref:Uncharacterized protein n=1 Tax=Elaeophora elaphi TaxID=1147741 RepID=A0A0R3S4A9_9BILA